jgi:hypothetical protein
MTLRLDTPSFSTVSTSEDYHTQSPEIAYKLGSHVELEATAGVKTPDSAIYVEILEHRSVGFDQRSQVVIVKLIHGSLRGGVVQQTTLEAGSHILAKFYDPRYAEPAEEWIGGAAGMCAWSKANETAAYTILSTLQGSEIPEFYGEYTYHLPTNPDLHIAVLLLEFIEDPDLTNLQTVQYSDDELKALGVTLFSKIQILHSYGVYHHDIRVANLLWGRER